MNIIKIVDTTKKFFYELFKKEVNVITVLPVNEGYRVNVEMIEEDEYMRSKGRKDLIGIYEVMLNSKLDVISFERILLKERGSLENPNVPKI